MHQSTTPSLSQTIWPRWASRQFLIVPIVETSLPVTFGYSLSSEAVVMREVRRWKRLWRRSLTRSHKRTSTGPSRSCWKCTTSALQPEEITSKGTYVCTINKGAYTKKSGNLFNDPRMCFNQRGDISTLKGSSLKLVDKFTYRGNSGNLLSFLLRCSTRPHELGT